MNFAKFLLPLLGSLLTLHASKLPTRGGYSQSPAAVWQEALLSGNGSTGMLVFGNPLQETVIFDSSKFYHPKTKEPLLPVWPYREVDPMYNAELVPAVKRALELRGYQDHSGHGYLMRALMAAGINEKEMFETNINGLLEKDFLYSSLYSAHFPDHRVFWSDVINALPTLMIKMLIDSAPGMIELFPAVPDGLETGSISGIKCLNQTTIEELSWRRNTLELRLTSAIDQKIKLAHHKGIESIEGDLEIKSQRDGSKEISLKAGQSVALNVVLK